MSRNPPLLHPALQAILEGLRPPAALHLDEWSERNVVLPKGNAFPGPYRLSHSPAARRILQCLSPTHRSSRVVVMAAAQMLKTQCYINAVMGWIDVEPANILVLQPTDKLAKRLSSRIGKSIDACRAVRDKVAKPRSRDSRNTVDTKEFDGGTLYIATAGSAANLAEIPARYVVCDEVDRMEASVAGEGDPVELAEGRTTTFEGIAKRYHVSTPTFVGQSKIAVLFEQGTREHYHVPCPHCGHLHQLVQDHFHYDYDADRDRVLRAWFVCPECGAEIDERHKTTMFADAALGGQARWVASGEGDGETVSFHMSAFYAAPGSISWLTLARQHARAKLRLERGDSEGMRVYFNLRLGLPFDAADSSTTVQQLQSRAEAYPPRVVPDPACVLTMFVDTQPNRLECLIEAWGAGLEHWVVDHVVLWGSPSESPDNPESVWRRLDALRAQPWPHAAGFLLRISAFGIDSGGQNTQDVYNYGAARQHAGCVITKGHSLRGRPVIASAPSKVDIDWNGRRVPEGARLWMLGTDTAKDHLFNRMPLAAGPGAMHFHRALPPDWFEQLLAERPHTRYHKGRAIREYVKPNGARNEALDCAVGNLAMAHFLGLHKWPAEEWQRLRRHLLQTTPDLFAAADVQAAQQAQPDPAPASSDQPADPSVSHPLDQPPPAALPPPSARPRARTARGVALFT